MARIWITRREARKRDQAEVERERIDDYRTTFGGPAGQRVLADLCQRGNVMQTTYGGDGYEASAHREGRRRLVLEIIETINRDPAAMIRMATHGDTSELFDDQQ